MQDKVLPKEEKSRLSPANPPSQNSSTSDSTRTRNPESKSPGPVPTSAAPFLGFVGAPNLPANHALSNSYEQAMAMQGSFRFEFHIKSLQYGVQIPMYC